MKRILSALSILATSVLLSATPVLSAESVIEKEYAKDECLLVAMNCKDNVDTYQQRIEKLSKEIAKGTAVYTKDELRNLNNKLDDALRQIELLTTS
jgi:lipid II:glycine glycyltransferase (peptidoglycan interpeptide bridge formation enzyme)